MRYTHDTMLPERAFQRLGRKLLTLEGGGAAGLVPTLGGNGPISPNAPSYNHNGYNISQGGLQSQVDNATNSANNNLNFQQSIYNAQRPNLQNYQTNANSFGNQQFGASSANNKFGAGLQNSYSNTYAPIAQTSAANAVGGQYLNQSQRDQLNTALKTGDQGTVSKLSYAAGEGAANQAMGQAQASQQDQEAQQQRNMARYGIDPNRFAAQSASISQNNAANQANAANTARATAYANQNANMANTANFGLNSANSSYSAYGTGNALGTTGLAAQNSGITTNLGAGNGVSGAYGGQLAAAGVGMQGYTGIGNMTTAGYGNQSQQYMNQMTGMNTLNNIVTSWL